MALSAWVALTLLNLLMESLEEFATRITIAVKEQNTHAVQGHSRTGMDKFVVNHALLAITVMIPQQLPLSVRVDTSVDMDILKFVQMEPTL